MATSENQHSTAMAIEHVQADEKTEAHVSYTPEEERRVLRKIDFILLPLLCGCYIFSFLDKTLLNYSSIFGLKKALHLEGSDYSWTGSIFYFGYMLGSIMWSKLVQRYPLHTGKLISFAITTWSVIVLLTPLVTGFKGLMINRFFLGLMESIIGAVFVIVTSNWWTRREQAFRTAFWLGGTPIGNFLGGLLSYAVGKINADMPKWKFFFVFFGSLSMTFAIILVLLMPDHQNNARWLTLREKEIALERVRANQNVTTDHHWKWSQFWETFRDPQLYFLWVLCICNTMPSTFASQFSSQIVQGFGFTSLDTTLVSTLPAATIQFGTFIIGSLICSKYPNKRLWVSFWTSFPPLIGASLLYALPTKGSLAGKLLGYYLTYTHSMAWTLGTSLLASNFAGHTKKTTASGFIFVGWAAGLIAGPQLFLSKEAPHYKTAFIMLLVTYSLQVICTQALRAYYIYENRRRDRLAGEVQEVEAEFTDESDFQQWRTFRYVM